VNGTIIAYPGTVHFRAGKRTAQRHTYAPFFPVLQFNQEQQLFFGGNFWDSRATNIGYEIRTPNRHRVLQLILKKWASLTLLAWRFGFSRLYTVLSSN
jgi:hypothetical protein